MRVASILLILAALGHAQWPTRGVIFNGSASNHGVRYRFATVVEPVESDPKWGAGIGGGFKYQAGKEHRVMLDSNSHLFFGYDLAVERADSAGSCRVTISPLSITLEEFFEILSSRLQRRPEIDTKSYQPLSLPTYPLPQIVRASDTIALDLLVSPDGKQRVVDYIQVSCKESEAGASTDSVAGKTSVAGTPSQPRDFSAQDLELRLVNPELKINDRLIKSAGLHGEAAGNVLWVYVPGKGRFLLSLVPYREYGFRRAGMLRGSDVSFQYGGDRYEMRSSEPLFRSGQPWNLYVRADEAYQSNKGPAFGAADRPERILNSR
ncbi:MAG TPA: hypothetical protein VGZ73_05200 [Bryobacteraceae bacterium]|jgi:hypothetical protein|nr:hypothetical protein [Bryobacteraceae bacterium]